MEIGTIIRSRRAARGLTQAQVAQALGVTATAVSKWERNASLPEITLLPALARLLGTGLNDLLAFQQEMTRRRCPPSWKPSTAPLERGMAAAFALAKEQRKQFPGAACWR
ncbi:MAG: helix-turn-helix domain-containing protein [Evtepia sp.]